MKVDFKLIGDRIKQIRKEKKISQEKLAEQLDVSIAYLSRVERGSSEINLKRIFDIATMLDVPVTYLIQGVSCKEKNYLNKELYDILVKCDEEKQRLIYDIAKIIAETDLK